MDSCREPVDPRARKQHCTEHMNEYNTKQREYAARQRTLPECVNYSVCRNKVPPGRTYMCRWCQEAHDERMAAAEKAVTRDRELDNCETVHELREFIKEWMI